MRLALRGIPRVARRNAAELVALSEEYFEGGGVAVLSALKSFYARHLDAAMTLIKVILIGRLHGGLFSPIALRKQQRDTLLVFTGTTKEMEHSWHAIRQLTAMPIPINPAVAKEKNAPASLQADTA